MKYDSGDSHSHKIPRPLLAAGACLVGLVAAIAATHTGVDLLLVAAICVALFATERTVGDWLGELIGPSASTAILAGCAVLAGWYMFSGGGRPTTDRFFVTAAHHGYTTIWYESSAGPTGGSRTAPGPTPAVAAAPLPRDTTPSGASAPVAMSPDSSRVAVAVDDTAAATPRGTAQRAVDDPRATVNVLTLTPPLAVVGQPVTLRAAVTAQGRPVSTGSVEFVVNGRHVATISVGASGIASVQFSAQVPGAYTVGAHYNGGRALGRSSQEATLTVVP